MEEQSQRVAVVVVPFPAQGHLNQLLHFSLHLSSLASGHVQVHYISYSTHIRQVTSRAQGWNSASIQNIHFHNFPLPPISTPPPDPYSPIKFPSHLQPLFDSSVMLQEPLSSLLRSLSATFRRVVVVHEPLMSFAGHAAKSLPNVESFRFQCVPVFFKLSFSFIWDDSWNLNMPRPPQAVLDLILTPFDDSVTQEFLEFVRRQNPDIPVEAGTLINTCRLIEGEFIDLLAREEPNRGKKLLAIGPLFPIAADKEDRGSRHWCLDWLNKQPSHSVVYVSFGTMSTMSDEQVEQLAIGLQLSKQRFLWVLRDADTGNIFSDEGRKIQKKLPLGFEEKVREMGIVVRDWAPQLEILAHSSTGCFVSHCGWNSCMESFTMGVPIIAWPMHSDQPRNTMLVTEYLKVGVMAREWSERQKTVKAEKIEESIKRLMVWDEGSEIRRRMKALSEGIMEAVSEGGSSREDFNSFVDYITR